MPLLCSNTQLDRAIERLDPVIGQFPALISARHARGTAHLRKWLLSASIQSQQLRSGPLTYASRLAREGSAPRAADALSLHRARRDFSAILDREDLPHTLAHLAVLEAYAGCLPGAFRRAERALRLAPDDPAIRNQLGLIRFLAGDVRAAANDFEKAVERSPIHWPWIAFNRARCAALLDDPGAPLLLRQYLELDPVTEWRREVARLLGDGDDVAGRMVRDPPAVLPGLTLRTSVASVLSCYGTPSREEPWRGLLLWRYDSLGVELLVCPDRGTLHLELSPPSEGEIEGVRIGDPLRAALDRWGRPVESGEGQMVFWTGEWGIGLEHDDRNKIVTLSLGTER